MIKDTIIPIQLLTYFVRRFILILTIILAYDCSVFGQDSLMVKTVFYGDSLFKYTPEEINNLSLDINYSPNKKNLPVIIYLHGGGLTSDQKYVPAVLKNSNFVVVDPNYRLSPYVKCPTYIKDVASSVAWVFNNISQYGGDSTKIYLTGFSAGAFLANMIFWDKSYLNKHNIDPDSLAGLLSISGQMTTHFTILNENGIVAGSDSKLIDKFSPFYNIRKTNKPVYFITGDRYLDMAGRYDQNDSIADLLMKLGCKKIDFTEFRDYKHDENLVNASFQYFLYKRMNEPDSLNEINQDNIFHANFNNGFITIESVKLIDNVQIYNTLGQLIYNVRLGMNGKYKINMKFDNHVLILKIIISGKSYSRKLMDFNAKNSEIV